MKRVIAVLISFVVSLSSVTVFQANSAGAADLSQFKAGRIIDDTVFTNSSSMSTTDIQNFLVSRNSTCLKNFRSLSLHDDNHDGTVQDSTTEPYGPGTMSAAEIIKAASDIYRISPKVILATLQKEQGLVTRQDCPDWRYNTALGYGCPDTAPCDQTAFGFTRQIDYGAYHFRGYFDDSLASVPFGVGTYNIRYSPDASCGSSQVYIQNRATAALYSYTPYQPNAAALVAGYGEAPCGAYGNRNFFHYFTDWFGSTYEEVGYAFEPMVGSGAYVFPADVEVTAKKVITIDNNIYVLYGDDRSHTLQLLYWNGSSWSRRILDGPGSSGTGTTQLWVNPTSIEAFSYNGSLQYFYTDAATNSLRHGFTLGGSYALETLDGTANSYLGQSRSLGSAISGFSYDRTGIQLYYFNTALNSLVHTWWNGQAWNTETLDGTANSYLGQSRSLGSAISGTPYGDGIQLFYRDNSNGNLVHTFILGGQWVTEYLDGALNSVAGNNIDAGREVQVTSHNGQLFVLYHDNSMMSWRLSYTARKGGNWIHGLLDGGSSTSKSGSASLLYPSEVSITGYRNSVQLFYNDSSNYLRHTWLYW